VDSVRALRKARPIAALLAALTLICLAPPRTASADWQRGVAYTAYSANAYGAPASDASLARLAQDGNTDVAIVMTVYMANPNSVSVGTTSSTPTDAGVLHAMQTARTLGLRVTLKPQVDLLVGGWRGGIAPTDPAAWFDSYEATIDHYADLARQGGASMYVIGTEFKSMTRPLYTARWQQLIAGVRGRFPGRLTYAANWDEYQQVGFWRDLDYIGVDAYWPVATISDQPVSALLSTWGSRGYLASLQRTSALAGKPVLFTEIGYRSVVGATIHPGIWDSVAPYDAQEQANAYEAAYQALASQPWFAGLYWWSWPAALPPNGSNGDYTPTYKPAETVMRTWNAQLAAADAPAEPAPPDASAPAPVSSSPAAAPSVPAPLVSPAPAAPRKPVHHVKRSKKTARPHHKHSKRHTGKKRRRGCAGRAHSLRCRSR
jgi:hypothetical protein